MTVAVLSGKGGTGKTFVSVNLAAAAKDAVYLDCDVEEPNGRLFLKPEQVTSSPVTVPLPAFDAPVKLLIPTGTLILPALLLSILGPLLGAGGMM